VTLEFGVLVTQLGGGLALFLYGMRQMTESLKIVAGGGMKNLLARLTVNRFTAAIAGAIITAVIQSSSVTTVLVVGFISAGLLTLSQSIGVILGDMTRATLAQSLQVVTKGRKEEVAAIIRADEDIDTLYAEIIRFLGKLSRTSECGPS